MSENAVTVASQDADSKVGIVVAEVFYESRLIRIVSGL
jgi:hypothetical protein